MMYVHHYVISYSPFTLYSELLAAPLNCRKLVKLNTDYAQNSNDYKRLNLLTTKQLNMSTQSRKGTFKECGGSGG